MAAGRILAAAKMQVEQLAAMAQHPVVVKCQHDWHLA